MFTASHSEPYAMQSNCSVRLCRQQVVANSPITGQPVCNQHMQADVAELAATELEVFEKITYFKKYVRPLRQMQQRLSFDLQHLDNNFQNLREALEKCQNELVDAISRHNDQLIGNLNVMADIEEFEKQLETAKQSKDMKQVFLHIRSMKRSLETQQLDSKLVRMDMNAQQVKMAAFPDVNARIRELQTCVERHLIMTRNLVELLDVSDIEQTRLQLDKTKKKVEIVGKPLCMAKCGSLTGFVIDKSGNVAKVQDAPDGQNIRHPSVFVAAESLDKANSNLDYLDADEFSSMPLNCMVSISKISLISPDSQTSGQLACSWDADESIKDMHYDNVRQQLFIAQKYALTVTDPSGHQVFRMPASEFHDSAVELSCITGDSDKLYALVKLSCGQPMMIGISKELRAVHLTLEVPSTCYVTLNSNTRIAVNDGMLMISDNGSVFTVCTVTGLRVPSESMESPDIFGDGDSGEEDNDIAEHLLFSDCQPGPRISLLTTTLITVTSQTLLMERSASQCAFVVLKAGKLFLNTLKFCRRL